MGTRLPGPSVDLVEHDDVPVRIGATELAELAALRSQMRRRDDESRCEPYYQPG
jgi:hypothetical protein